MLATASLTACLNVMAVPGLTDNKQIENISTYRPVYLPHPGLKLLISPPLRYKIASLIPAYGHNYIKKKITGRLTGRKHLDFKISTLDKKCRHVGIKKRPDAVCQAYHVSLIVRP